MRYQTQLQVLHSTKSTWLPNILDNTLCQQAIFQIQDEMAKPDDQMWQEPFAKRFAASIFNEDVNALLQSYYGEAFTWMWPVIDVVDDDALINYASAKWHVDGGLRKMLKLFVYFNAVAEHQSTTLMMDPVRTKALHEMDALPLEQAHRHSDVSQFLLSRGLPCQPNYHEIDTGGVHIFDPLNLAHRCRPPIAGKKRYTLCFSLFPKSAFG